jgi:hypothetical protein
MILPMLQHVWEGAFASDEFLPFVLESYLRFGSRQSIDDVVATRTPRLNPKDLEAFTDINALEPRVRTMLKRPRAVSFGRYTGWRYFQVDHLLRTACSTRHR